MANTPFFAYFPHMNWTSFLPVKPKEADSFSWKKISTGEYFEHLPEENIFVRDPHDIFDFLPFNIETPKKIYRLAKKNPTHTLSEGSVIPHNGPDGLKETQNFLIPKEFTKNFQEIKWTPLIIDGPPSSTHFSPCLFLDRDGIINEDTGYPHKIKDLTITTHIQSFVHKARKAGYLVIVVTNQSGIGRGLYGLEDCQKFNAQIELLLNFKFDDWMICPYHSKGLPPYNFNSIYRKPMPGMFLEAMKNHSIDLSRSLFIGDRETDLIQGIPIRCYLIQGKYPIQSNLPIYQSLKEIEGLI